jgi:hypothetical protein
MNTKTPASSRHHSTDADLLKGAVESDSPDQHGNSSLSGQLGHRSEDDMIKSSDTDFPEPGENPEHSGEPEEKKSPEGVTQDQQGDKREGPLAS